MSADPSPEEAIRQWQLKHRVPDGDPVLIFLELARLSLRHACAKSGEDERIPSYAEYRETVELMDNRSKVFIGQAKDLLETMRLLTHRLEQKSFVLSALMAALGFAAGALTVLILR
jgi:hypothetical protein